jgi:GxxExxY protein
MKLTKEELPHILMGAAMEVHKCLGPGLHVEAYRDCLAFELKMREIIFQRDVPLNFNFKGHRITNAATLDFVVEDLMLIKVEAVEQLQSSHKQALTSYLRLSGYESGFLINFNVEKLRDGIKRIIVSEEKPDVPYR